MNEQTHSSRWPRFVFLLVFVLELGTGYYLAHIYGFMSGDASSRVANAFYVLYSRHPALANIGFVWNPLPSLLELIPLALYPIYKPLASSGLAAVLLTSFFSAWSASLLMRAGLSFGLRKSVSLLFALLYALNPYIFYYGANGLTEAVFISFVQLCVVYMLLWMSKAEVRPLLIVAFALALAFWTRYETVTFGMGVALAAGLWIWRRSEESRRERWHETEGTWTMLLAPVVFSGLIWIFFNYTIMGDPLYFLTSSYSNLGQAELIKSNPVFAKLAGNPWETAKFVGHRLSYFSMPLAIIVLFRAIERRLFRVDMAVLLALILSIPAMQYGLLLKGGSAAWIRYYLYPFPIAAAWIPYEIGQMKLRRTGTFVLILGFLASAGVMGLMMNDPKVASDEYEAFHHNKLYAEQQAGRSVSAYINERHSDQLVLTDSFSSFRIVMDSDHPKRFIVTSDPDFARSLEDPAGSKADYVLLPNPQAVLSLDALNQKYPQLYADGADWAELEQEFGGYWKLYRIVKPHTVQ
ncbi:glycosyltransferase family 39 protein [Cohnella nanjingensis]|uniref:Glycosyltransferase family 39 protein n=1 Tax=Cohnella nanjingensis TaxID=1387779 RepID=A0A7X0RP73_9BACL|nr:glycosyltransferase family 39 protein [Cohnella nanjingensis]MBB6669855.1 glycosyltransferase family 39 protein [Cohnella nanjingensis]